MSEEENKSELGSGENPPKPGEVNIVSTENDIPAIDAGMKNDQEKQEQQKQQEEQAIHTELQTETMEAHRHSHVHHSKKWKDYLFEFIMLFLAVTAGFFVENQREHYVENMRAKQYSKHLLSDLRLDSAFFENRNRDLQFKQTGHEKLLYTLTQKPEVTDKDILEALLPISFAYDLPVTTTTYNQMKASGSLRYIHNQELTAVLQNYYDVLLPRCNKLTEASISYYSQYINNFYLEHVRIQDYDPFNDSLINKNPEIINRTSQTNQQLANIMGGFRSLLKIQEITMNDPALKKIKEIIPLLKEEYNLE